jgi:uncharacterized protein (DUF302 family)
LFATEPRQSEGFNGAFKEFFEHDNTHPSGGLGVPRGHNHPKPTPKWDEEHASGSEKIVKADRKKDIPISILQKKTVNKLLHESHTKDLPECKLPINEGGVYSVDTHRSIAEVAHDLEKAINGRGYTVMNVYDLQKKLSEKGQQANGDCLVLEIGNTKQTAEVLAMDPTMSLMFPSRIAVFGTKDGARICTALPTAQMNAMFAPRKAAERAKLAKLAEGVEESLKLIMQDAK